MSNPIVKGIREELREAVGDELTAMLLRIAEFNEYPGDQAPFDRTPIVGELVELWSVERLLEVAARELPHLAFLAETPESMQLLSRYLCASAESEARIVLQLVGLGDGVDRDDDLIAQCLAVPRPADVVDSANQRRFRDAGEEPGD